MRISEEQGKRFEVTPGLLYENFTDTNDTKNYKCSHFVIYVYIVTYVYMYI